MRNLCAFFCAYAALSLLSSGAIASACVGRIEGNPNVTSGDYDPFDAADFRKRQTIAVRNIGNQTCSFVLAFQRIPAAGWFSSLLPYSFENDAGAALLSDAPSAQGDGRFVAFSGIAPSQIVTGDYYIVIPRGQYAAPGSYYDDVKLALFGRDEHGGINATADDVQSLHIEQRVLAAVGINVAGGGLLTTLSFGRLATGVERSVILQTRANHAYQLTLRSAHGSELKLDPEIPGLSSKIPYSLRVNAQPVSLSSPTVISRSRPSNAGGEESHSLAFRIEEVGDRPAGLYRDTVTVDVSVNP